MLHLAQQELALIELPLFFLSVRQAAGGKDIEEQPEDVQDQANIGVHGASIRGTRVPAQLIVPGLGRVFAHYKLPERHNRDK
ncbi:MAG: hypothetical protein ABIO92_00280 [Chloroflexia bacterium]